jgi:nitrile hydratase subunit beta
MDGIHDLGGKHGFGPVRRPPGEPVFGERWEALVFALVGAAGAGGLIRNTDQFRHAIERIDPVAYLSDGYYGRWLAALETLAMEAGWLDAAAVRRRLAQAGADPDRPLAARPEAVPDPVPQSAGEAHAGRSLDRPPRFAVGDLVRARARPVAGHTRLPAYARGCLGTVAAWHGAWVYPDSNAHGGGECPQHLYSVSFTGQALWGAEAEPETLISLDLFEPYLEAAT